MDSPPAPSLPSSLTSHPTPFGPFLRDYSDSLLASQYLSEQELLQDCSAREGVGDGGVGGGEWLVSMGKGSRPCALRKEAVSYLPQFTFS